MKSLNDSPLVGPVHPDLTIAQMQVVRHIEKAFKVPVKEVKKCNIKTSILNY